VKAAEDTLMAAALDAGADDMRDDGDNWEVLSAPEALQVVKDAVEKLGIEPLSAQVAMLPKNFVSLEGRSAQSLLKLLDLLEDHDDVQHVWSNVDIDEKELEAFA
jgi:transcriptional/translational regulatory protein YebC/TACO1